MAGALRQFGLASGLVRAAALPVLSVAATPGRAQDATWVGGKGGDPNEWVEPNNWTPATVPTGTATSGAVAATTTVVNDAGIVTIGAINFTATALAYTFSIDNPFLVNGTGVVNDSANTQTFNVTGGNSFRQ